MERKTALRIIYTVLYAGTFFTCLQSEGQSKSIVIKCQLDSSKKISVGSKSTILKAFSIDSYDHHFKVEEYAGTIDKNLVTWAFNANGSVMVGSAVLLGGSFYMLEPGDSINVYNSKGQQFIDGKGADKVKLIHEAAALNNQYEPTGRLEPLERYLAESKHYDHNAGLKRTLLKKYKPLLSPFVFSILEANVISQGEHKRLNAFWDLLKDGKAEGLSSQELIKIFDSTIKKSDVFRLPLTDTSILSPEMMFYHRSLISLFSYFKAGFSKEYGLKSTSEINVTIYNHVKSNYVGLARQKLLTSVFTTFMIQKNGLSSEYSSCIDDFMQIKGYPHFKSNLLKHISSISMEKGKYAPFVSLPDEKGKLVSLAQHKNKVVILNFWNAQSNQCITRDSILNIVKSQYLRNKEVVIISVSTIVEKDVWLEKLKRLVFTKSSDQNLYTNGLGQNHPIVDLYNMRNQSGLYVVGYDGKVVNASPIELSNEKDCNNFVEIIYSQLVKNYDGPYISYKNQEIKVRSVLFEGATKTVSEKTIALADKASYQFDVATDVYGKTFACSLRKELQVEPSVFPPPSKMFVASDIEGNFRAFRKLLQANDVIDSNFNWTFDTGHVVLVGDFFDRGDQVTETLWLIYSLEIKARQAGGYVHFILGNHEIMNLSEKLQYVHQKYLENARILNESYNDIWGVNSELGRWLRTKNIVEKIGDCLFVHGGISNQVNQLNLSLEEINEVVRNFYSREQEAKRSSDNTVSILYSSKTSPFWYRGYYIEDGQPKATFDQISKTLVKYQVSSIITGHTICSDTVSVHFGNAIINVDTKHAAGESEALLIFPDKYYRVDALGNRQLLVYDKAMDKRVVGN